jgi:DNA polymerase-1
LRSTASGKASTDEEALFFLSQQALQRLSLVKEFVKKEKFADEKRQLSKTIAFLVEFRQWQETAKLLSTYTDFPVWSDGRVHTSFKIHGTKTGRLASDSPNMQNVPKATRHIFVAGSGDILVEADYSNLELRVLAYLADDQPMINTFKKGKNIHEQNTFDLFGLTPKDKGYAEAKRAAKIFIFGRNYGGGLRGIFERVAKEVPSLGLTYARFCDVDAAYNVRHPASHQWFAETKKQAVSTRCVANAFGRKRLLLGTDEEIGREGMNTPIQGTAADIINQAMISLHADFAAFSPRPCILLQVHDSLLVECKISQKAKVTSLLRSHMEKDFSINGHTVRFPVEITSGKNWGSLE